jgi:PKD repeat protein
MHCEYTDDSRDPDGAETIAGYERVFGDGERSTTRDTSHDYATAGRYAVTLTVTDDHDVSDTAEEQLSLPALADTTARGGALIAKGRS